MTDAAPGRDSTTVERFAGDFMDRNGAPGCVRPVTCDTSPGFQKGIREHLPHARRIADRFHVARHANEAVDRVRKAEGRENGPLKRTKHLWLGNEAALSGLRLETNVLLQFFLSNFCTIFPQYGLPVSSRNCTI